MYPRTINRIRSLIQDYTHGGQPVTFLPVHVIDLAEDGYIKPHVDSIKFSGGGHVCTHVVHHEAASHGDKTIHLLMLPGFVAGLSLLSSCVMRLQSE